MPVLFEKAMRMAPVRHRSRRRLSTVLVVDDEPAVLSLLRFLLMSSGYACLEARNAEEALHAAQGGGVDVLLLDADLPDVPARSLARGLRQLSPEARVLFLASSANGRTAVSGLDEKSMVPKPVAAGVLLRTIREVLSQAEA